MADDFLKLDEPNPTPFRLVYSNHDPGTPRCAPRQFTVSARLRALSEGHVDSVRLELPSNWVTGMPTVRPVRPSDEVIEWRVSPCEVPRNFQETVRVVALSSGREVSRRERTVDITVQLSSQFVPSEDVISRANNTHGWGVVKPQRDLFDRTYGWVPFREAFFNGLYRAIVFLNGDGSNPGGLCTGMARAALDRSLTGTAGEPILDEVVLSHGRQLTDRALLAGACWLIFGSPKRAFESFRGDLLRDGRSDRCFDIGVPRPWRRDIISALETEGHTVVPYAFVQSSPDRAQVLIYDPNDPHASRRGEAAITFLLDRNSYGYEPLGKAFLERSTVVAVRQSAYRSGRTAVLAGCASAVLSLIGRRQSARAPSVTLDQHPELTVP